MARHGVAVVGVMGNNGIWALEHHPMKFLYGYSVAAELRPETRYDQVVEALGGHGELVREPDELRPALERALRGGQAGAGQRAHRPERRLPAQVEPRLSAGHPETGKPPDESGGFQSGPVRTGRGTCHEGAGFDGSSGGRRRFDAASPEPMSRDQRRTVLAAPSDPDAMAV